MKKLLIGTLLFAVGVACTSSSSSGGTSDASCDRYFNALYKHSSSCGGRVLSSDRLAQDMSRFRRLCQLALAAPGTGATAGWVNSCAASVEAAGCNDSINTDACILPPGSLGVGAACGDDDQCVATAFCKLEQVTTTTDAGSSTRSAPCGKCVARTADGAACDFTSASKCMTGSACNNSVCVVITKGGIGGSCAAAANATCNAGLICDATTEKCKALGATGDACQSSFECKSELMCTSNACAPRPVEGAPCTTSCAPGLACSGAKCVKRTFGKPGEACDGAAAACEVGSCVGATAQQKGTCPAILADGAACDSSGTAASRCDDYATCNNGVCTIDDPTTCK